MKIAFPSESFRGGGAGHDTDIQNGLKWRYRVQTQEAVFMDKHFLGYFAMFGAASACFS